MGLSTCIRIKNMILWMGILSLSAKLKVWRKLMANSFKLMLDLLIASLLVIPPNMGPMSLVELLSKLKFQSFITSTLLRIV